MLRWSTCIRESSFSLMPPSTAFPWDCFCEIGIGQMRGGIFPPVSSNAVPMHFPSACSKRLGIVWRKLLHPKTKEKVSKGDSHPQQGVVGCWGRPRAAPGSLLAAGRGSRSVGWVGVLICFVFVSDFYIQQRSVWWKPVNFVYLAVYCTMGL